MPGSSTVLYVEDDESDALFMQRAFANVGLASALRVVEDGRAAMNYLSGANGYANREEYPLPSLVLLDLNLPLVHGFDVLKWIREQQQYASTPVVIFTSSTRVEDKVRAQQLGATEFVEKPHSGLKFKDVVQQLSDRWLGR